MNKPISILVAVYKGSHVLTDALDSIYNQKARDIEVIVADDNPMDETAEIEATKRICAKYKSIRYIKNKKNLGCQMTFQVLLDNALHDTVLFLAQDDIFAKNSIQKIRDAFEEYPEAGFITRPYFWFEHDIHQPIRYVPPIDTKKNTLMKITDGERTVKGVFGSVGQISGLAYKKSLIKEPYHPDIFPGHIYPIAELLTRYPGVFLKDYIVAIGTLDSQSRKISSIYDDSPTEQWMRMFRKFYQNKKYESFYKLCVEHMATNYEGLVQLKNYGKSGVLEKEITILVHYRPQNMYTLKFWAYSLLTLLLPRSILRNLSDFYKRKIVSRSIPQIKFEKP